MSLDLLRGATIAAMVLVNNAGDESSSYWPLQHAQWNGWTPTDLIFPFFLFMVGVSMAFSFRSRLERGDSRWELTKHVLVRGLIIFAIGLFLNGFPNHYGLSTWRVYGVLQRIGICYIVSGLLVLWTGRRTQIAVAVSCLVGYWVMMRYIPVPGFGIPTHDMPILDPDRNLVAWLDRKVLMGHLYEVTRDPEGILSNIPSFATSLLGALTGAWLRSKNSPQRKVLWMFVFGALGLAAGEFFNTWFPINKKLWTSSFVLFTAGFALVCLSLCYWLLDVKQWRGAWTKFFLVFGMNSIATYVFAELIAHIIGRMEVHLADGRTLSWQELIYERVFGGLGSPAFTSLLYALTYVLMCWLAMWVLYRKKIFLKV